MADEQSPPTPFSTEQIAALAQAFKDLRFGSVEITVHQGQITQIERRERQRFQAPGLAVAALALLTFLAPIQRLWADDEAPAAEAPATLQSLDQKVKILERKLENQDDDATAAKKTAVTVNADANNGLSFYNADKTWGLKLGAVLQVDSRTFFEDYTKNQADAITPRRGRFLFDANLGPKVKFRYQYDFVTSLIVDAYGDLKLAPWATLRTGLFKTPLSLERYRSDPARDFVELGYTTDLVTDRDSGALIEVADADQAFLLDLGVFDGSVDNTAVVTTDTDKDKDVVAKVFTHPFRALDFVPLRDFGFGVVASSGNRAAGTAVSGANQFRPLGQGAGFYTVTPTATAEGEELRVVPQGYLFWQGLSLLSEYVRSSQFLKGPSYTLPGKAEYNLVSNEAYDVQLGWVLTGEDAGWNGVKLNQSSSSWGALQLVGRYQGLNFDQESFSRYDAAGTAPTSLRFADPRTTPSSLSSWGVALNYTPVNDVKLTLDWEETHYTDGNKSGAGASTVTTNRETEKVLFSRVQFAF